MKTGNDTFVACVGIILLIVITIVIYSFVCDPSIIGLY